MNPHDFQPDRRQFLRWTSVATAVAAAHGCLAEEQPPSRGRKMTDPRIVSLDLKTAAPLAKMKEFYHQGLGVRILDEQPERLTVAAGETRLTFTKAAADHGKPFYHFAFNIPENKVLSARTWQMERTPLMPVPERLRDPKLPDDVVNYSHWNAHSLFFLDPGGNVVEYIARHDLKNAADGPFGSKDILYASEIAYVVDDVPAAAAKLKEVAGVEQYRGGSDEFMALGDEHGLLLVMKRGRILSLALAEKIEAGVFPTVANVRGAKRMKYVFPKFPYEVSVEG